MDDEIIEPTKNNLPNGMIDWNEISEFIIDMLDNKRANKGWKLIDDTFITKALQDNSVIALHLLHDDLYDFFYNLHLDRNIVWDKMESYIREKYSHLSDEALSRIIATYHIDDM